MVLICPQGKAALKKGGPRRLHAPLPRRRPRAPRGGAGGGGRSAGRRGELRGGSGPRTFFKLKERVGALLQRFCPIEPSLEIRAVSCRVLRQGNIAAC